MNSLCDRCLHLIRRGLSSSAPLFQSYRLIEIGKLEDPQNSGYYQAGQVSSHAIAVLHRIYSDQQYVTMHLL